MGLLESIEQKLTLLDQKQDMLMSAIKAISGGNVEFAKQDGEHIATVTLSTPAPAATESAAPAATTTENIGKGGLDLNAPDATGVPWDERIHSSSQKQTGKNVWSKRKNVPPADFNRIHAELLAAQQGGAPSAAPAATTPASPTAPTASPSAPASPAAPATNPVEELSAEEQSKQDLIEAMNKLTNDFKVEFDTCLSLLDKFNAKTFDTLDPANYDAACRDYTAWAQWLGMIKEDADRIIELGGDNGKTGVATIYGNAGATELNGVKFEHCNAINDQMKAYRSEWEKFAAAQAG